VRFPEHAKTETIKKYQSYFQRLARVMKIEGVAGTGKPKHAASAVVDGGEIFIPLEGLIDLDAERQRIQKEMARVQGMLDGVQKKLSNESFVGKAPKEVVEKEREKLESIRMTLEKLGKNLEQL